MRRSSAVSSILRWFRSTGAIWSRSREKRASRKRARSFTGVRRRTAYWNSAENTGSCRKGIRSAGTTSGRAGFRITQRTSCVFWKNVLKKFRSVTGIKSRYGTRSTKHRRFTRRAGKTHRRSPRITWNRFFILPTVFSRTTGSSTMTTARGGTFKAITPRFIFW